MMTASASLLFLAAALLYFSGTTCAAAFRPSGELGFGKHNNNKKKPDFVRECRRDFMTLFHRGGGGITPTRKLPTGSRFSKSILLASAKDESFATRAAATETEKSMHPMIVLVGGTTSFVVATSFFVALAYFRDATMVSFWLGAIINAILSKVLKKMINQSRPPELVVTTDMAVVPSDGGMPSSHAMSLAFIGTCTALLLPNYTTTTGTTLIWTAAVRLTLFAYAAMSLFYRVQVKFHTWEQIAVGVAVGAGNAALYHFFLQPSLMTWLATNILHDNGLLPIPMLLVPIIVGLLVVGSVERRIAKWLK